MAEVDPFSEPVPAEVPLASAPLVRVLGQVRFPPVATLARLDSLGPFQEAVRSRFPVLRRDAAPSIAIGPQGLVVQQKEGEGLWRFMRKDGTWRISLAPDFLALETSAYSSRTEFFETFQFALRALHDLAKLEVYDRLGVRYINRLTGRDVDDLGTLVRPEVVGIAATMFSASLVHSLCESAFAMGEDRITARWGVVPGGVTPDPTTIEALDERNWILDFDMFTAGTKEFLVDAVVAEARRFSERIYALFRWSVRPAFLTRFGGRP